MKPLHEQASEAVLGRLTEIAAALVEREFARHPELEQRYGITGRKQALQDAGYHLSFLAQSLAVNSPGMFGDHVAWSKVLLTQRRIMADDLALHLECLMAALSEKLPGELSQLAGSFVANALQALPEMPEDVPSFPPESRPLSPLARQYSQALLRGERDLAGRLVKDAVAAGTPVGEIYLGVFQPAQHEIGRLWQTNRISVAQEHYCTAATQLIMSQLHPHIFASAKHGRTLVATCVLNDLHEIGVRMVADFFEMEGWNTFYLGASTPHAGVISTLVEQGADVLAISATISLHVSDVRDLICAVRAHPSGGRVKCLVGGYPFNRDPGLWRTVGADGCAENAPQAVTLANQLVEGKPMVAFRPGQECIQVDTHPATATPGMARKLPGPAVGGSGQEDVLYYELTRLNNDMANLQRQLAKSNQTLISEISERKRAEKERQIIELQLRQSQKLESIGQLAAGIAHEMNSPLQYIGDNARFVRGTFGSLRKVLQSCAELFVAVKTNAVTPDLLARHDEMVAAVDLDYLYQEIPISLDQALEGIERVSKIIQAMKGFSQPGSNAKAPANLNQAIENTVTISRHEWKNVADVKLELAPDLPAVPCHLGEFNQCILNLVVNSTHAIEDVVKQQPGTKGLITVGTRRDRDQVEVWVTDTGTGIPEAVRTKIFDPFFTTKAVGKGIGQGLSTVYANIVKKHGGTVTFETEIGRGTSFIVRLPITPISAPRRNPE